MGEHSWQHLEVKQGTAYVFYAFDVGFQIHLDAADRKITSSTERARIKSKSRISKTFEFVPAPLRVTQSCREIEIATHFKTRDFVEALIFDFGAISVCFRIPLQAGLDSVIELSQLLYDNAALQTAARQVIDSLLGEISSCVEKLNVAEPVEDYVVFHLQNLTPDVKPSEILEQYSPAIASLLRSEAEALSRDEIAQALSHRISYGVKDLSIIDWNAALILEKDAEDQLVILEFANIALLEFSILDWQLDKALEDAYNSFQRKVIPSRLLPSNRISPESKKIAQLQIESTLLYENISNGLKLLGDEFLARFYRHASESFGIPEWDAAISRKIATLENIYEKMNDAQSGRRMELLEWIVIILIAVSILLPFVSNIPH